MNLSISRTEGEMLGSVLDTLLPEEPDLPYGNFAPIAKRPGAAVALHRGRWLEATELGVFVAHDSAGKPLAAVRLDHRGFESKHFGMPMAKIERPIAVKDPELRERALRAAYEEAFRFAREAGYVHVAARCSTRDPISPWVLQELGAFHVDTQVSWIAALSRTPHDDILPPGLRLQTLEGEAIRQLPESAWRRLQNWAGHAFDRGPFVFDRTVDHNRALEIYKVWTAKAMTGEWADALVLVYAGEEIVAFNSVQHIADVSELAETRLIGRGLGATLPEFRGLFTAIQREMIAGPPLGADYLENETQVATIGSINVYARLGNRFIRSTYTFHRRLDRS